LLAQFEPPDTVREVHLPDTAQATIEGGRLVRFESDVVVTDIVVAR
jgi:hypothetical protein